MKRNAKSLCFLEKTKLERMGFEAGVFFKHLLTAPPHQTPPTISSTGQTKQQQWREV
jgi:hypothetical protein